MESHKSPSVALPSWVSIKRWTRFFRSGTSMTREDQECTLVPDQVRHTSRKPRTKLFSPPHYSAPPTRPHFYSGHRSTGSRATTSTLVAGRFPSSTSTLRDPVVTLGPIPASPSSDSSDATTVVLTGLPANPAAPSPSSLSPYLSPSKRQESISIQKDTCTHRDFSGIPCPSSEPVYIGPYSRVYKQEIKGGTFAIKVVNSVGTLQAVRRRMRREVETGSRLDHPNVLTILGTIEEKWCPYGSLVTRWCVNGDGAEYIRREHLNGTERLHLFQGVSSGLRYLHSCRVVHGDLKPKNVLIDEHGTPLICDFGLARILDVEAREKVDDLNTTTFHPGTVRYLAFELVEPDTPAERTMASDVHALGCVGYEFLYLEKPYASRINNAGGHIFRDIANGIPPAYRPSGNLGLSEATFWDLLELCWDREPERRPTASVVCATLETSVISDGLDPETPTHG